MKRIVPFLYQDLLDKVLSADWPKVLIWGGRSLGRTEVLQRIAAGLETTRGGEIRWIRRGESEAGHQLAGWARNPQGYLFVDDLERLWQEDGDRFDKALATLDEAPRGSWRIFATACHYQTIVEKEAWSGSASLNGFRWLKLDPWHHPDQARGPILDALRQLRGRIESAGSPTVHPILAGSAPQLRQAWVETILRVTEGHPALLGASFDGLAKLLLRHEDLEPAGRRLLQEPADDSWNAWREQVWEYLEDQIMDSQHGIGKTEVAIQHYRMISPHFHVLAKLAENAEGGRVRQPLVRKSLESSGLVYRDTDSGRLKVAGSLTRQRIREIGESEMEPETKSSPRLDKVKKARKGQASKPKVAAFKIQLQDYRDPSNPGGVLQILEPNGLGPLDIHGSEWKILHALGELPPKLTATVGELREITGLETDAAIRSALQRLREKIREHGTDGLVETVRGKGFRLRRKPEGG